MKTNEVLNVKIAVKVRGFMNGSLFAAWNCCVKLVSPVWARKIIARAQPPGSYQKNTGLVPSTV